jgi:hypothetical protein
LSINMQHGENRGLKKEFRNTLGAMSNIVKSVG